MLLMMWNMTMGILRDPLHQLHRDQGVGIVRLLANDHIANGCTLPFKMQLV